MKVNGIILFDIDGVIRNVENSYRLSARKTVEIYCGWEPTNRDIDKLKNEGLWNNDWDMSLELIKRYIEKKNLKIQLPKKTKLIETFNNFYFGYNSHEDHSSWRGFINNEELLVDKYLFEGLSKSNIKWGFVSGAERKSAKYVLENKLGLNSPPLIAMGEAPEKPNPTGLLHIAGILLNQKLGCHCPPIAYLGDTVADVQTIINARDIIPEQKFISLGIAPPHLHSKSVLKKRLLYESNLKELGADFILQSITELKHFHKELFK